MPADITFWIIAIIAVFITGVSKSGFAGGIGVIAVPLLALVISPIQAVMIMLPLLIIMDIFSLRVWWGKQLNPYLKLLLPAACCGIFIGYYLFEYFDDQVIRLFLGVTSICFALWGLLKGINLLQLSHWGWGPVAGAVSGFTSFLAHAGGPPLNIYLIPQKLKREEYLATAVVFFAVVNLIKLIPYGALGQLSFENLTLAFFLAPVAWLGVHAGVKIQRYISDKHFFNTVLLFLLVVGMKLVWDGL